VNAALLDGKVVLHQPARGEGYRVNVDALHLAAFAGAPGRRVRDAADLGAGVGAVALALLSAGAADRVRLVEVEARAVALARKNLAENGWSARGDVVHADVLRAAHDHPGSAQLVVCNPPFVEPGRGRVPSEPSRARARSGGLAAFAEAARIFLARRGRACFVYPANELATLLETLRGAGLEPKRLRAVHASASRPARVVLVEAQPAKRGGLVVEPALVER
jgi:tRNA1Val (adenine37-N6)-methyltransferase